MLPEPIMTPDEVNALANRIATATLFADYQKRLSPHTRRRHRAALATLRTYFAAIGQAQSLPPTRIDIDGFPYEPLYTDPAAWGYIEHGLILGFIRWREGQGYAIGTLNDRLSVVKTYCRLAHQAGAISAHVWTAIQAIRWYRRAEGRHLDSERALTRIGAKKAQPVRLSAAQARALKTRPDTPQGRRDAVLMYLLLDHGLRCGEVALLQVDDLDRQRWELRFFRPKVHKLQTHRLTADTIRALTAYHAAGDLLEEGTLLRGSRKDGRLEGTMSIRAITARVAILGAQIGVDGLSAHDCRHYWATAAARGGTDIKNLKEAGGWNSLAMPDRYIQDTAIANINVRLAED